MDRIILIKRSIMAYSIYLLFILGNNNNSYSWIWWSNSTKLYLSFICYASTINWNCRLRIYD